MAEDDKPYHYRQGNWVVATGAAGIWYIDDEAPQLRSRQDCDDLIALLERVRERLP